jgi:hypothetical protein
MRMRIMAAAVVEFHGDQLGGTDFIERRAIEALLCRRRNARACKAGKQLCKAGAGGKKTCLEMGVAGEADARLAFGRSARLGRLLVVVNHRVLPSAPMVGRVSGSSSARTRV